MSVRKSFVIPVLAVVSILWKALTIIVVFGYISRVLVSRVGKPGIVFRVVFSGYAMKPWIVPVSVPILNIRVLSVMKNYESQTISTVSGGYDLFERLKNV